MKKYKKSIKNFLWLGVEKVLMLAIELLVMTQIAKSLGVSDFGTFIYITTLAFFISPFSVFGLSGVLGRYCIDPKGYNISVIMSTAVILKVCVVILSIAIFYLILQYTNIEQSILNYALLLATTEIFKTLLCVGRWFDSQLLSKWNGLIKVSVSCLFLLVKIFGIYTGKGIEFFVYCLFFEVIFYSISMLLIFLMKSEEKISFKYYDKSLSLELFKLGGPLLLSAIGAIVYLKSDVFIIEYLLGENNVGIYSAGTQVIEVLYALPIMICTSIFPIMMSKLKSDSLSLFDEKVVFYLFVVSTIIAVFLYLLSEHLILLLYGDEFFESSKVISIYAFSLPIVFLRAYLSKWIIAKEIYFLSLSTQLFGAFLNIVLNFILIPYYGLVGAAWATIISMFLASTFPLYFSKDSRYMGMLMTLPYIYLFHLLRRSFYVNRS
jgi:O-antigen/teichoic acid export membrane protein